MWHSHSQSLRFLLATAGLIWVVTGCGATNAETPRSPGHSVQAGTVALQKQLHNRWRYPPAITKHYPTTGVAYHIPSAVGLASWHGNPTRAVLAIENHLRAANTVDQVKEYSDSSFWGRIAPHWHFTPVHSHYYHEATEPLTVHNVGSFPASHSPYAGYIQRWYGSTILNHSWVLAVGWPGQNFSTWYKTHPALTPWLYFVDVRGHWLLYSIQN